MYLLKTTIAAHKLFKQSKKNFKFNLINKVDENNE